MKTAMRKKSTPSGKHRGQLESSIISMAASGELAKPARLAIRRARRKGLPVTFQRGSQIIEQFPDGRERVLGKVDIVAFQIPAGVRVFEKQ